MFRNIVMLIVVAALFGCAPLKQKFGPSHQVLEVDDLYINGENFEVVPMRKVFASSCWTEVVDEAVTVKETRTVNGKMEVRERLKKFPLRKAICPTPATTAVAGSNYGTGPAPLGMAASGVRMTTPNDVVITTPGNSDAVRGMREILGN